MDKSGDGGGRNGGEKEEEGMDKFLLSFYCNSLPNVLKKSSTKKYSTSTEMQDDFSLLELGMKIYPHPIFFFSVRPKEVEKRMKK